MSCVRSKGRDVVNVKGSAWQAVSVDRLVRKAKVGRSEGSVDRIKKIGCSDPGREMR